MKNRFNKKGQEEMVGFILIIIVVSVILVFILGAALKPSNQTTQSYEAESFISAVLPYTTTCKTDINWLSVNDLLFDCVNNISCLDNQSACNVLNLTMDRILNKSWSVGPQNQYKGYEFSITSNGKGIYYLKEGNITGSNKGYDQSFVRDGDAIDVTFKVYS